MTDYRSYRDYTGISNADMTAAVRKEFPLFTKITAAMANAPDKYGVCLLPEAEQNLVEIYGPGPGLQSVPFEGEAPDGKQEQAKKVVPIRAARKQQKRAKPNRITFSMTDEVYSRVLDRKQQDGFASMQELIETLLLEYLNAKEKGKHEAG